MLPPETTKYISKIERAYLWSAKDTTTGAKCKVNWVTVCRPKKLGGIGILHMEKFARALRLRWPWLEWKEPDKIWKGSGNPCSMEDMEVFYASTTITLGNGHKAPFWHSPWLNNRKPIEVAPLIFEISKRKNWKVHQALRNNEWVKKIDLGKINNMDYLRQFVELWGLIESIQLRDGVEDDIVWRLTANGEYSSKSAYEIQFIGAIASNMNKLVWKAWAPPKVKFFAWLLLQNRIWTADRLQARGWQNCDRCTLCNQTLETVEHLFINCRYTARIWDTIKDWVGIPLIQPANWVGLSIDSWWNLLAGGDTPCRKAVSSLTLLITWEIWNERNARIFRNKHAPTQVVIEKIKTEARLWVLAGAKHLGNVMPGE
jgi:hypothetical protein